MNPRPSPKPATVKAESTKMPLEVPWSYLIRFLSPKDDQIYFGDVIMPSPDFDIGAPANRPEIRAKVITGNPLSVDCIVTEEVLSVKKLLGPLTPDMVPAVRCIGGNYGSHLRELGMEFPRFPIMFPKQPHSVAGYGDDVTIPKIAQDDQADYENELTVVIGRDAKNVAEKDALDYVLGYTVGNDVSARKWQMDPALVGIHPPPQMSFSKSFDQFCPLGPCIVSTKVIKNPHELSLTTKINGELRQNGRTSDLIFKIPRIIEFCSQGTTLPAGSIILTGTPKGVGYAMSPPQFLRPGDIVEMTIGKIGTLTHGIAFA